MKYGLFKIFALVSVVPLAVALNACGDDSSTSSPTGKLPTEVKDLKELEEHKCGMSVIGEKVFVESEDLLYECDGDAWFKSYDQTKPNSAKSSSSTRADGEGDDDYASDSENGDTSNSSGKEQSSGPSDEVSKVMPTGYYKMNCPKEISCKDATSSFEYLNQEILAAGKYGEILDTRDGQVYKTIKICDSNDENCQTWMAQNLNYAYKGMKFREGEAKYEADSTSWCIANKVENCDKYGRLYIWSAVMDSVAQFSENAHTSCGYRKICTPNKPHRGICPEGWHVPTNAEFFTLYTNIGETSRGTILKSTSDWNYDGNGTDDYGFSLLPGGYMNFDRVFRETNEYAYLWTSTQEDGDNAKYQIFCHKRSNVLQDNYYKYFGRSLRCVKD